MLTQIYRVLAVGTLVFMVIPCSQTASHSIVTFYTQLDGTRQEFCALTEVDGQKIFYNDSKIKNLTYKQELVKKGVSEEVWKQELQNSKKMQEIFEKNIRIMKRHIDFKKGMQTFQRTYGCKWNEKTSDVEAFDTYGYDGEDFMSLDIKKKEYVAFSPQALHTKNMWNTDKAQLEYLIKYYNEDCIILLKEIVHLGKTAFDETVYPKVSLLKKDPSSPVVCHVTGFYPPISITWTKNPYCKMYKEVEYGNVLPNENGTFQQCVSLVIDPEDWDRCIYYCNVEQNGSDKNILVAASKNSHKVKSNFESHKGMIIGVSVAVAVAVVIAIIIIIIKWCNKPRTYNSESSQPLVNTHSGPGASKPNTVVYI